jgi:hypothetical protein
MAATFLSITASAIQGLKQQVPNSREEHPPTGCIRSRQVLGGLINDYYREAA